LSLPVSARVIFANAEPNFMRKLILTLVMVMSIEMLSHAAEAIPATAIPQTEQTETSASAVTTIYSDQDDFSNESSEEAKKKRRKKKKKKNPAVKWIVGGVVTAAALVLYIATDGEGWHSR
jgi:hypothetical protein